MKYIVLMAVDMSELSNADSGQYPLETRKRNHSRLVDRALDEYAAPRFMCLPYCRTENELLAPSWIPSMPDRCFRLGSLGP